MMCNAFYGTTAGCSPSTNHPHNKNPVKKPVPYDKQESPQFPDAGRDGSRAGSGNQNRMKNTSKVTFLV
jgi:hypothetical protein